MISVIIPNWNGWHLLPDCLDSLLRQRFREFEVIVVDNGSTDGSLEGLALYYPQVRVIALDRNYGFPWAVNRGIERARGDYIALLNNDTECHEDWLSAAMAAFSEHLEVGFIACKLLYLPERRVINAAGDECFVDGRARSIGVGEEDVGQHDEARYVFGASAAAAVYRRQVFERVGLFDEDFFLGLEDVDIAFRAQLAGFRCLYVPAAIVYHHGSASLSEKNLNSAWLFHLNKNEIFVAVKNLPPALLRKYRWRILACHVRIVLSHFRRGAPFKPWIVLGAKCAALRALPRVWRKRRQVQKLRVVSDEYVEAMLVK